VPEAEVGCAFREIIGYATDNIKIKLKPAQCVTLKMKKVVRD